MASCISGFPAEARTYTQDSPRTHTQDSARTYTEDQHVHTQKVSTYILTGFRIYIHTYMYTQS